MNGSAVHRRVLGGGGNSDGLVLRQKDTKELRLLFDIGFAPAEEPRELRQRVPSLNEAEKLLNFIIIPRDWTKPAFGHVCKTAAERAPFLRLKSCRTTHRANSADHLAYEHNTWGRTGSSFCCERQPGPEFCNSLVNLLRVRRQLPYYLQPADGALLVAGTILNEGEVIQYLRGRQQVLLIGRF